jgi:hypothetical protein
MPSSGELAVRIPRYNLPQNPRVITGKQHHLCKPINQSAGMLSLPIWLLIFWTRIGHVFDLVGLVFSIPVAWLLVEPLPDRVYLDEV